MNQVKYCFRDLKNHKGFYFSTTIQLIITFLILGSALTQIFSLKNGMETLSKLSEQNSYVMIDTTTESQLNTIFDNEKESLKKLRDFFLEINNFDNIYLYWKYSIMTHNNTYNLTRLTANQNFVDLFRLKTCKGRMLTDKDYLNTDTPVPIIIGYELQSIYKLGNTYILPDGDTNIEVTVVGVLKNNSSYLRLGDFGNESLDNTILFPFSKDRLIKNGQLSDFDMALQSIIFISDNNQSAENFSLALQKTDTFFMHFEPLTQNLAELVDYLKPQIEYEIVIAGVILFFAMIGFISNLITMINNNMVEYAIHICCGASIIDLYKRIFIQTSFAVLISLIPCTLLYSWNILMCLLIIQLLLLTMIIPIVIVNLKQKKVTDVIRRFS